MTDSTPLTTANLDARVGRRQALRIGGLSVSLAALVAACGDNRDGDTAPGRVGNADPILPLPDYDVNNVVLLRTASSLELTAVAVYETAKGLGVLEGSTADLVDRIQANHQATADKMAELTEAAGGTAWTDTNPWIMERAIVPIVETIAMSDDMARDVINLAITLENLAASTHQSLTSILTEPEQRLATANAATEESRHSAALVLKAFGTSNRFSPALVDEEVNRTLENTLAMYAINSAFGSLAQKELIIGEADESGSRTTFLLATPAANSFIYEELG
jgi:hypothetical protein